MTGASNEPSTSSPGAIVGIACALCPFVFDAVAMSAGGGGFLLWTAYALKGQSASLACLTGLLAGAAACALACAMRSTRALPNASAAFKAAGSLLAGAAVLLAAGAWTPASAEALCGIGCFLLVAGHVALAVVWRPALAALSPAQIAIAFCGGLGGAVLIAFAGYATQQSACMFGLFVGMPLLAFAALGFLRRRHVTRPQKENAPAQGDARLPLPTATCRLLVAGTAICSLICGLSATLPELAASPDVSPVASFYQLVGMAVGACAMAALAARLPFDRFAKTVAYAAPVCMVLLVLPCVFRPSLAAGAALFSFLSGASFLLFFASIFTLVFSLPEDATIGARKAFPTLGAILLAVSPLFAALGCALIVVAPEQTKFSVPLLVVLCLFAASSLRVRQALAPEAAAVPAAPSAPSAEASDEQRLDEIAARYRLTPREVEVLAQLAKGRPTRSIGDALFISYETTRAHIKHIYEKTGVHSRSELIDLIYGDPQQ